MGDKEEFLELLEKQGVWVNPQLKDQLFENFKKSKFGFDEINHAINQDRQLAFKISRELNYPLVPPDSLLITITNRCNLRCKMCQFPMYASDNELSLPLLKSLVDQAISMNVKRLNALGGEPFITKSTLKLMKYAKSKGMEISTQTNGLLINENNIQGICETVDSLGFSIDGLEENHDFIRGKGNFRKTLGIIEKISKLDKKPDLPIVTVLMNHNFKDTPLMIKNLSKWHVSRINIQPLVSNNINYTKRDKEDSLWIKESNFIELDETIEKIKELKKQGHPIINTLYHLERMKLYFRNKLPPFEFDCYNGFNNISVWSSGLVGFCFGAFGDVRRSSLKETWYSKKAFDLRQKMKECKKPCLQNCQELKEDG